MIPHFNPIDTRAIAITKALFYNNVTLIYHFQVSPLRNFLRSRKLSLKIQAIAHSSNCLNRCQLYLNLLLTSDRLPQPGNGKKGNGGKS
ncbi:MAG: hypothetical protein AAFQ80_00675 [Cyanobacteria bacterium J06621_8]